MNIETVYNKIKSRGKRLTKVRKAIIDILLQSPCLLSTPELLAKLKVRKFSRPLDNVPRITVSAAKPHY
jgi:Fe2+ or Zn2+ uptake regulation protein